MQALKRILRHLARAGAPDVWGELPRERKPRPRAVIATPEEIARLLAHAEPWMRCFILLCLNCGLRYSTACRAAPIHYDPARKLLRIDTKGGQVIEQPVSPALEELFALAPEHDPTAPYVLLLKGSHRRRRADHYVSSMVRTAWARLKVRAAVRMELGPHDLRRTLAVAAYEVHRDIRVVQQVLGHADLGSTAHYLEHRDPTKLRPLLEAIWKPPTEVKQ